MSLLRRRGMMEGQEQEENVLYIYSGYLYVNGNVNDEPAPKKDDADGRR